MKQDGHISLRGIDEIKLLANVHAISENIDRDKLLFDRRVKRVQHPLLVDRIGKEKALNFEIYKLVTQIISSSVENLINKDKSFTYQDYYSTLSENVKNRDKLHEQLENLKKDVRRLFVLSQFSTPHAQKRSN